MSNQIAHALSRFVVGPHSIVAVILHRNVLMYVKQLIFVCISVTHTITLYPLYPYICTYVHLLYMYIQPYTNTLTHLLTPPYTLYTPSNNLLNRYACQLGIHKAGAASCIIDIKKTPEEIARYTQPIKLNEKIIFKTHQTTIKPL